jgi:perosamine synthetase
MRADQPRIDPNTLKSPDYARHYTVGWNYRMNDITAELGLAIMSGGRFGGHVRPDELKQTRQDCAALYREAIEGCDWLTPQLVPEGWSHDMWTFAVKIERDPWPYASDSPSVFHKLANRVVRHGAEHPYACWKITYQEPAFRHLAPDGTCPIAEDLQPRLVQFQTNDIESAKRNAHALRKAIQEIG